MSTARLHWLAARLRHQAYTAERRGKAVTLTARQAREIAYALHQAALNKPATAR